MNRIAKNGCQESMQYPDVSSIQCKSEIDSPLSLSHTCGKMENDVKE